MAATFTISLILLCCFVLNVHCSPVFGETSFVNPFLNRKADDKGKEKTTLQKEILDIFGVDHRPHPNLFYRDTGKEMSARKYMIDLYNSVTKDGIVSENDDDDIVMTNVTTNDSNAASADTVVSFVNHGKDFIVISYIAANLFDVKLVRCGTLFDIVGREYSSNERISQSGIGSFCTLQICTNRSKCLLLYYLHLFPYLISLVILTYASVRQYRHRYLYTNISVAGPLNVRMALIS